MEISYIAKDSIKIKGKQSTVIINPTEKASAYNAAIILGDQSAAQVWDEAITIDGPGEYEVGGTKITGQRSGTETVYTLTVDKIDVLVGKISAMEKMQNKIHDHQVVVVNVDATQDAAFLTAFSPNVLLLYGTQAEEAINSFEKDGIKKESKYQTTIDKLPQEMEMVLLA